MAGFVLGIVLGPLLVAGAIAHTRTVKKAAHFVDERTGWSLYVGANYIETTGATGRREYRWDDIRRVTIEEIRSPGRHQFIGLHVEFADHDISRWSRPAGWPSQNLGISPRGLLFPVCVLGPMTDEQRTELTNSLARHGGLRWNPPAAS